MVFIFVAVTCSALSTDVNGVISYSPDTSEPFDFGTRATYSCTEGFYLPVGGNIERMCEGDGSSTSGVWSGTAPPDCLGILAFFLN